MSAVGAVWLVGFRAAGKSTTGRALATTLGWRFVDLDEELERRLGVTILSFVEAMGIERFRAEEEKELRRAASLAPIGLVIATGGGFVEREASRKIVAESPWPKLWLDPPEEVIWERLEKAPERRKIGDLGDFAAMQALHRKRRPFYEKIATFRSGTQDISECLALLKIPAANP